MTTPGFLEMARSLGATGAPFYISVTADKCEAQFYLVSGSHDAHVSGTTTVEQESAIAVAYYNWPFTMAALQVEMAAYDPGDDAIGQTIRSAINVWLMETVYPQSSSLGF